MAGLRSLGPGVREHPRAKDRELVHDCAHGRRLDRRRRRDGDQQRRCCNCYLRGHRTGQQCSVDGQRSSHLRIRTGRGNAEHHRRDLARLPEPGLTCQWQLCDAAGTPGSCTDISRATTSDYTLITADAGLTVRAVVTATNAVGDARAASSVRSAIGALPANVGLPSMAGATIVGDVLSAAAGTWTGFPTPINVYQWQRSTDGGVTFTNTPTPTPTNIRSALMTSAR